MGKGVADMKERLVTGAVIAGFFFVPSTVYGSLNTRFTAAVVIPLGALLCLCLGIVTWKIRGKSLSSVLLFATAWITGAVFGLALIAYVLD